MILRISAPLALCILLVVCGVSRSAAQAFDENAEQEILNALNAERNSRGLATLRPDPRLTDVARRHSQQLAQNHSLSHQFPGEPTPSQRMSGAGTRFDTSGENVAEATDAESAHRALMNSPPHRANVLNGKFTTIGVGVVRRNGEIFVTQDFVRAVPELTVDEAEQKIRDWVLAMRRGNAQPLQVVRMNELRKIACDMARADSLRVPASAQLPGARTIVSVQTSDLGRMPDALRKFRDAPGASFAVGACFAPSASHPIATYWAVVMTFQEKGGSRRRVVGY